MSPKLKKKKHTSTSDPAANEKPEKRIWTDQENEMLISRMIANLPTPDTTKFSVTLDKVSWNEVAFNNFSASDCRTRWDAIIKEIRKFRTLTEILDDAKEYIKDPYKGQYKKHPDYPKRPLTPYFRFFVENRDDYARKHSHMNNLEVTAELSKMYRTLPQNKKDKYTAEWKKETALYRVAMEKFKTEHPHYFKILEKGPKEPRQPIVIYRDEHMADYVKSHPKLSSKACSEALKTQFRNLPDEEKLKYVTKALKEEEQHTEEMDKFEEMNPEKTKKKKRNKTLLTKQERKLSDKLQGKPKRPPSNGYNLFCTEMMAKLTNLSSQQRIVECGKLWNQKSNEEKSHYHTRHLQLKQEYEANYKKFFEKLSPTQQQKETQFLESKSKSNKRRNSTPNPATAKRVKVEDKLSSSSSEEDDDSSDDDSDDVDLADSSESADDESEDSDDGNESEEEKDEEKKDEEDERFRKLVPARPTTPISALFLYQKAHRKKVEAQYPSMSSDEITRLLARRYHELPEHKRHKYLQKEKEQRALYNEKMQQHIKDEMKKNGIDEKKPEQPQAITGEQVYSERNFKHYLKKSKNNKEEAEKMLRMSWSKMTKAKREPFITTAQERNQKNILAYQAACKEAGIANGTATTTSNTASSSTKKLKFAFEPKKPPTSGYQLYSATHMGSLFHLSANEKFKEIGRKWTNLPPEEKQNYNDEVKRRQEKYKKDLSSWLKTLPPDVAFQYEASAKNKKRKSSKTAEIPKEVETIGEVIEQKDVPKDEESSESADSESSSSEDEEIRGNGADLCKFGNSIHGVGAEKMAILKTARAMSEEESSSEDESSSDSSSSSESSDDDDSSSSSESE